MPDNDKRRRIMQATETLFTSRRFHEVTLDDVARAADVAKGTIYLYFKDKEDLFFQTALAGFDGLCDVLQQKIPGDAPFEQELHAASREILDYFCRRQQISQMIQTEDARMIWCKGNRRETWDQKRSALVTLLAAILRKGVTEGKVRTDITTEAMASVLVGVLQLHAVYLVRHPESGKYVHLLVDLFYRGAAGGAAPRPGTPNGTDATGRGSDLQR